MPRPTAPVAPAFAVPAVAIALGALATVRVAGAAVAISWVDLACIGVLVAGGVAEARRRRAAPEAGHDAPQDDVTATDAPALGWWPARHEPALWAYLAFLAVVALQFVLPSIGGTFDLEVATGASRFVGPASLLLGLTWLRPGQPDGAPWNWPLALTLLGVVMSVGVLWDVVAVVGDAEAVGFYDWKRAIAQPVGVSNIVAGYTAASFWPALVVARRDRRWLGAAVAILVATLLTLSRAAVLGLVVSAAVLVLGRADRRRVAPRMLAVAVAGLTVAITVGTIAADTRPGAEGAVASALRVRDEQYTAAFRAWQDAPLLGVGLNRFEEEVTVETSQPSAAAVDGVIPYEHPNNAWLMALAEVGLLGAAAWLALWVLLASRIVRHPDPVQQFALAGAATGLAVHAQLEALTFTRGVEVLLALLLAAAWTPNARRPEQPTA